jgi:hypothetical protein
MKKRQKKKAVKARRPKQSREPQAKPPLVQDIERRFREAGW